MVTQSDQIQANACGQHLKHCKVEWDHALNDNILTNTQPQWMVNDAVELLSNHEDSLLDFLDGTSHAREGVETGDDSDVVGKKRGRDSPDSDDSGCKSKGASLRLPDAIDKLATEGTVLKYDTSTRLYTVLDGLGFEARFEEIRCTRVKRSYFSNTNSRPFSRMHSHYVLVTGEKWAKTGTVFRAKGSDNAQEWSKYGQVPASQIIVNLLRPDSNGSSQVTLQHLFNTYGARNLLQHAISSRTKSSRCQDTDQVLRAMQQELHALRAGQEELRGANAELKRQNDILFSLLEKERSVSRPPQRWSSIYTMSG